MRKLHDLQAMTISESSGGISRSCSRICSESARTDNRAMHAVSFGPQTGFSGANHRLVAFYAPGPCRPTVASAAFRTQTPSSRALPYSASAAATRRREEESLATVPLQQLAGQVQQEHFI